MRNFNKAIIKESSLFIIMVSIITIFSLPSCKPLLDKSNEGTIVYEISYSDFMKSDMMASLLPSKMILKYKPALILNEFKVGMGIITATIIANEKDKTLTSLFKVVDKKYALQFNTQQTIQELKKLPKFSIKHVNETKIIAGFKCKKAIISEVGHPENTFPIFYTNEIQINNPNWNLPFHDINGVLLEYPIKHNDINMKLTAKKVELVDLDDELFIAPEDYKQVQKEELPEIIQSFF